MKINLQNYEAYFIDYIEGTLDESAINELKKFLAIHPHLQNILEQYTSVSIPHDTVVFNEKTTLYKFKFNEISINENTYNDFCIAYYEDLLSDIKKTELHNFIETNPEFKNNFLLYKKTYLQPEIIVFPERKNLYKKEITKKTVIKMNKWFAVAASLIIITGFYFGFLNNKEPHQNNIAHKLENPHKSTAKIQEKTINSEPAFTYKNTNVAKSNIKQNMQQQTLLSENSNVERNKNIGLLKSIPTPLLINSKNYTNKSIAEVAIYENVKPLAVNNADTNSIIYEMDRKRYFLLSLVETSLNQFNKISRTDFADVSYKTDRFGKITSYSVKAGFIEFHRNREKN